MLRYVFLTLVIMIFMPLAAELVVSEAWSYTDGPNATESVMNSAVVLPNGDILSVGYRSGVYNDAPVEYPLVIRHDASGNIVNGNLYMLSEILSAKTRAIQAKLLNNGEVFIGCTSTGNGYGAFVFTINPNTFQVTSHYNLNYTPVDYCVNTATGSFHVFRNVGSGNNRYIEIVQYDAAGILISSPITISSAGMANSISSLEPCPDGGYLLAGSRGSDGLLIRFNSYMQITWEQLYTGDGVGTQVLNHAIQSSLGEIFAAGKDDGEGYTLLANYSGTLLWQYTSGSAEYVSVCETEGGNFAAAGAYGVPFNPRPSLLLYSPAGEYLYSNSTFDYYGWYNGVCPAGDEGFVTTGWRNTDGGTYMSDVNIIYFEGFIDNPIEVTQILPFEPNPTNDTVSLMATESQAFSITASDPDGHTLNYAWRLNGEIVSETNSYTFQSELSQAGESFNLFLSVDDNSRSSRNFMWTIEVTEYIYPPYAPYPNLPWDNYTGYAIDMSPSLSWNYSSDENHSQDRSVLYLGTRLQDVNNMDFSCKVQDDGTLHDSYSFQMMPNQTYYWRVVVYNGSQYTIGDVWTFTTEEIISSFPYSQDFEGGFLPPTGWLNYVSSSLSSTPNPGMGGGWSNAWDSWYVHAGSGAVWCTPYQMPQYYWLVTPFFNLSASSELHFWMNYLCTAENPTELHVMIKTALGWQLLHSFDSAAETNLYASEISLSLGEYYGQNARLAFVYNCNSNANPVAIDDFRITNGTSIPIPQNLLISQTESGIELSWDSASAEELFQVFESSSPTGPWIQVSGSEGFSWVGNRCHWSTETNDRAFYMVKRIGSSAKAD
ncbi:MAG TPA: choice-of-anchor J domain-containing protein [Candidatus Cloacimonadota bacterium]|nr:choice-of-anchor J domain-containing protein [Candidatus Cloacimonadota bacterium]